MKCSRLLLFGIVMLLCMGLATAISEDDLMVHYDFEDNVDNHDEGRTSGWGLVEGVGVSYVTASPNASISTKSINCSEEDTSKSGNYTATDVWNNTEGVVSWWVRRTNNNTHNAPYWSLGKFLISEPNNGIQVVHSTTGFEHMVVQGFDSAGAEEFKVESNADYGWHHFLLNVNSTRYDLYVDGVYKEGDNKDEWLESWDTDGVEICGNTWDVPPPSPIDGLVDEYRMYNRSLNNSEDIIEQVLRMMQTNTFNTTAPAAPALDYLNISTTEPDSTSQFNTVNLSFNGTANSTYNFNCSLYIDGLINLTNTTEYPSGTDVPINFTIDFASDTETNFTYFINCYNEDGDENTTAVNVYIDNVNPDMTWYIPVNANTSVFGKEDNTTFTTLIELSDPGLFSWRYNISLPNGTQIYNFSNISLTGYTDANITDIINYSNYTGVLYATTTVCDGHTGEVIKFDKVVRNNNELQFDGVKIYLSDKLDTLKYDYEYKTNRYSFNFTTKTEQTTKTFVVESPHYIKILHGETSYRGHLVTDDKWIDFEMPGVKSINVVRLTSNSVEVTIESNVAKDYWEFNSIGELNCHQENRELFVYGTNQYYEPVVLTTQTNTLTFNLDYNSSFVAAVSANLTYNGTVYEVTGTDNGISYNFTKTLNAPALNSTQNITFYWTYSINDLSFSTAVANQSVETISVNNCSSGVNSINFTLRDSFDDELLNGTIGAYVKYWVNSSAEYYEANLTWYHTTENTPVGICFTPATATIHADIQMEYSKLPEYATKNYYFVNRYMTNTTSIVDLYLNNGTTIVTLRVTDFDDNPLDNIYIKILKYDVTTDSYVTDEIVKTDSGGNAYAQMVLNTVFYQFVLERNGVVELLTLPTKIITTSKNFRLNINEPQYFEHFSTANHIQHRLWFNNATKRFSFWVSDTTGNVNTICLNVIKRGVNSDVTMNNSCFTTSSATILYTITEDVGKNTYIATGFITIDGEKYLVDTLGVDFDASYKEYGLSGIFIVFFLALAGIMMGVWHPLASILIFTFIIVISTILNFFHLGPGILIVWIIMAAITIYRLSRE